MDIKSGRPYPAGALSNFVPRPFIIRSIPCASMEGFLQGLKFKSPEMQRAIFQLTGMIAKQRGKNKNWRRNQVLYFQGEEIKRDSPEYQTLLDEAFAALFENEKAKKALLDSGDAVLTHNIGKNKIRETVLTNNEFCGRLMKIREKLRK